MRANFFINLPPCFEIDINISDESPPVKKLLVGGFPLGI
jgi:hypothetical protein